MPGKCSADPAQVVARAKKATALVEISRPPTLSDRRRGIVRRTSFGTAFCIDASGLFVTNAHVAKRAEGDGLRLVLDTAEKNPRVLSAKVVRTDDALDLALLRVDKADGLVALELGKVDQLFETMQLTAFGYPYGRVLSLEKDRYPAISVNMGRITSLRQKQGELELIQLDAMLNPGNSGGPVLDGEGRVVGIVQFGVASSGINFAIPVSRLEKLLARPEIAISVPSVPAAKQHQPHEITVQVVSIARPKPEYVAELTLSTGPQDVRTMTAKVEDGTARFQVVPVPALKGTRQLLVTARFSGGSVSGRVADREVKLGGQSLRLHELRRIQGGEKPVGTLADGKEVAGAPAGLENVEIGLGDASITMDLGRATAIAIEDAEKGAASVDCKVVVKVGGKVVGEAARTLELTGAVAASTGGPAATVAMPGPVALSAARETRSLPGPIAEVAAGGNGRYLFLHLPKLRKLAVFDVSQAKVTHYLPLPSDEIVFAGGSEKLVVIVRDQRVVQRYSLANMEKDLTVAMPEVGTLDGFILGYASAGPAMLMTRNGPRFLDLAKLALLADIPSASHWRPHPQYPLRVRVSADGSTFAAWEPGLSPSGIRTLTLEGRTARVRYEHSSAGALQPSYDGALLFTGHGLYTADLRPIARDQFSGVFCFPSYHPAYFLGAGGYNRYDRRPESKFKLSLYTTADKRLLVSLTDLDELNEPQGGELSAVESRIHFFPTANLLVTIPAARDQLVLRRLDVAEAMDKAGIDYLFVSSTPPASAGRGETYRYAITAKSKKGGVRFMLDSGPEGMSISSDGRLQWKVPAGQPPGPVGVIVTLRDASGQEVFHSFNVNVR